MSYSQFQEEESILAAFSDQPPAFTGSFLDIGAWHPIDKSNTRALYERGWRGVMIEPSPYCMMSLIDAYGNDDRIQLIQAAAALQPRLVRMRMTKDGVSTSSEEVSKVWDKAGGYLGYASVPAVTLEQISNQFGGFDFISIDAEGVSAELFLRAVKTEAEGGLNWEPKCWCVEHDGRTTELMSVATERRYHCTYSNSTNLVLVRKW